MSSEDEDNIGEVPPEVSVKRYDGKVARLLLDGGDVLLNLGAGNRNWGISIGHAELLSCLELSVTPEFQQSQAIAIRLIARFAKPAAPLDIHLFTSIQVPHTILLVAGLAE